MGENKFSYEGNLFINHFNQIFDSLNHLRTEINNNPNQIKFTTNKIPLKDVHKGPRPSTKKGKV